MPRMLIEWTSAGSAEADEALAEKIADYAIEQLEGHDPIVSGELVPARGAGLAAFES